MSDTAKKARENAEKAFADFQVGLDNWIRKAEGLEREKKEIATEKQTFRERWEETLRSKNILERDLGEIRKTIGERQFKEIIEPLHQKDEEKKAGMKS